MTYFVIEKLLIFFGVRGILKFAAGAGDGKSAGVLILYGKKY